MQYNNSKVTLLSVCMDSSKDKKQKFTKDDSIQNLYKMYKDLERKKSDSTLTIHARRQIELDQKKMINDRIFDIKGFAINYIDNRVKDLGEKFKNVPEHHIPNEIKETKKGYQVFFSSVTNKNEKIVLITEDDFFHYSSIQELASQRYSLNNSEDRRIYLNALLKLQKDEKQYVLSKKTADELKNMDISIKNRIQGDENKVIKQKLISLQQLISENINTHNIKHPSEIKAQKAEEFVKQEEFDFLPSSSEENPDEKDQSPPSPRFGR